ncbi:uncharacterized protein LOC144124907 [Amblyomma americanum]
MHRSLIGHGGILSGNEHTHLRMQSSRSDSLIHEMAHSSESRSASQRTSGNGINGLTSIHITPISSGMESMFDSRTSRDQRVRGKTRSGEANAFLLAQQLEESGSSISSRRARRLSGSQIRHSRSAAMSASLSPTNREEHGALRELVEMEMHGVSSGHGRLGSPMAAANKAGSFHSSSEMRHEAQRHTSSSLAADAKSSRSGALQAAHGTSSGHVQDSRTVTSSEKMVRALTSRGSKGVLESASKTEHDSAKRLKSLTDQRKMSASKLSMTSLSKSATHKELAGVPGMFSTDATLLTGGASQIGQGIEMSTTLTAGRMRGAAATKESNASSFASREKVHAVGSTAGSKSLVSSSTAETAKLAAAGTTVEGATTESQKQVSATGVQQKAGAGILTDSRDKPSLLAPGLLEKKTSSKSMVRESVHQSRFPLGKTDALSTLTDVKSEMVSTSISQGAVQQKLLDRGTKPLVPGLSEKTTVYTSSTPGRVSSNTIIKESVYERSFPSEKTPETAILSDAQARTLITTAEQNTLQQSLTDKQATHTLLDKVDKVTPMKTSSKSQFQETTLQASFTSQKAPDVLKTADTRGKTTYSTQQVTLQQTGGLEIAGATLLDTHDKTCLLAPTLLKERTSSKSLIQKSVHRTSLPSDKIQTISTLSDSIFTTPTPKGTSSKSILQESVYRRSISSERAPDTPMLSDVHGKTVTAAEEQGTFHQQTLTDKQSARTLLDTDDKTGLSFQKETQIQESINKEDFTTQKATDMLKTADAQHKTVYSTEQAALQQTSGVEQKAVTALVESHDKPLLEKRTTSKSLVQVHRASFPSDKMALNTTLADTSGKMSTSVRQETIQHKLFDSGTTFILADSSEKSGLLTSAMPKKTSSRSLIQESVHRALSSPHKAPDALIVSDNKSTTLTTFSEQGAVQQIVSDKGTAQTQLDVQETSTVMPPSSLKKRPSSRSLLQRTSFQMDKQADIPKVTVSQDELLVRSAKLDFPQQKTSTKSVSKESVSRTTSSSAKAAGSKEEILGVSANEDVTQRKVVGKDSPTSTDASNYLLSSGAQLTMTQKSSARWKDNAPFQQLFFEKIEGSKYQKSFDSALDGGVKEDFQSFQITSGTEPTQVAIQPEPLLTKSPHELTAEYASERKEKQVGSATTLTPMPEFPLLGSTPKASSEEVHYTETERRVTDRSDALQWPRFDASSRLGAAAALFDTPLETTHFDQRPLETELSQSKEMIEQTTRVENQAGASVEFPRTKRVFGPKTREEYEQSKVVEPLIEPQTAHLLYEAEVQRKIGEQARYQTYTDSNLVQYTPQDPILAEIVREVERKIEASARYHVEPLPDDVLTVRSSKGIESLGLLKYETYEEELLMRRSVDDLTQEPQKPVTETIEKTFIGTGQVEIGSDQEAYSGVLEEFYSEAARKKEKEQEPAELIQTGALATVDTTKEVKVKTEELVSGVTEETQEESRVTMKELEQRAQVQEREVETKKLTPEKPFDLLREERKRLFEQHGRMSPISGAQKEERKASVQEKKMVETTRRVGLITAQSETDEREGKVYVKKHEGQETSENAVRRFIAAAIEEAARREEAKKGVKRFREFPCSAEESSRKVQAESSESSAMESSAEQERRIEELKVEKEKSLPQLVRCKSIAELIEQIIEQHVSGTDVRKHAIAPERQEAARTTDRPAEVHPNIIQQQIPVYYQTATTSPRLGDQYVDDYRYSLLGVGRKSDGNIDHSQLESASQGEHRISFSSGRGARCVIRKLEPGALTYLVEVAPADKAQENQTDMVMAEEQVLVSEIFDHITAPSLRASSSGTKVNEPITLSPAASLTAIRNAYAEAVARRILGGRSASGAEGVLAAAQKAQFFDQKQWSKDGKTASSTSVHSAPSVEDYMLQTMLASGMLKNKTEPWAKKTSKFESEVSTRAPSVDKLSKTAASSEGIVAPPPTPPSNAEYATEAEEGTESGTGIGKAQELAAQTPKDVPPNAAFASATAESASVSTVIEAEKPTVAAEAAGSAEKISSAAASGWAATQELQTTTTTTTVVKSETQQAVAEQQSAGNLKGVVRTSSSTCALCNKQIPAEKALESFICFGLHDVPTNLASIPSSISENVKLRIATDDDVRQLLSLPFKDADSACVVPAAVVTRHILCPRGFFVAIDISQGTICGAASIIIFDEEVAFCGFCHIFEDYQFNEVGALLWNQMLHLTSGKNLFTLLPEPASQELQNIYQFPFNPATGILFGTARLSRAAFARTILVLEYKDKYFDALASYDKHVFGFNRKRYLASTVHEVGLDIRVATRNERNICGYGGVQRDEVGRRILRWLFADDAETAESLLSSLLASCSDEDEVDLIAAFFLRSTATRPILDKIGSRELKPWRMLYTKREPVHSYGRIVCLTTA